MIRRMLTLSPHDRLAVAIAMCTSCSVIVAGPHAHAQSESQLVQQYVSEWAGMMRARWVTYRYDFPHPDNPSLLFAQGGYVSDAPREWSKNLDPNAGGANVPIDPFDGTPKNVAIMVHGYGAPFGLGGHYAESNQDFFTADNVPGFIHETGATAWFDNGQAFAGLDGSIPATQTIPMTLYSYLRFTPPAFGFDPDDWVILATTMNILPEGIGLSIIENSQRLLALVDLLWALKGDQIRTISFISHSTGSPIVKAAIGVRQPASAQQAHLAAHPWINLIDDHVNLAGALGGTPSILADLPASGNPLHQQLLYGIQDPLDFQFVGSCYFPQNPLQPCNIQYRYTGGLTVGSDVRKRTYRWPAHINVLSVAGVWDGGGFNPLPNFEQPFDGNPFSSTSGTPGNIAQIPNEVVPAPPWPVISMRYGKSDGVVPNRSVIERVEYSSALGTPDWKGQVDTSMHYSMNWNADWRLPAGSSTADLGGGPMTFPTNADNVPAFNVSPSSHITYVEINAHHNGMMHNQHLSHLIKRRLGTFTVIIPGEVVWVDFNHSGLQNGSFALPFNTLAAALAAVNPGGTIRIMNGSTSETAVINQHVQVEAVGGTATIGQ